jgi:hypothetical protein
MSHRTYCKLKVAEIRQYFKQYYYYFKVVPRLREIGLKIKIEGGRKTIPLFYIGEAMTA